MRRPRNPVYLFAKPCPEPRASIAALDRYDRARPAELLHNTLFVLGDRAAAPADWLPALVDAVAAFDGLAFPLAFDRVVEGDDVTKLACGRIARAPVRTFQHRFRAHLARRGVAHAGGAPTPHVTLAYRRDGKGDALLPRPIAWRVEEVLLVESIVGAQRHVVHACRPLHSHRRPCLMDA